MILFFIGFGMLTQNLLAIMISSLFPLAALLNRIRIEEKAFVEIIGDEYTGYKSKTKKLIPFIY
jgi:protein-S-isoprenylcysteine O-methyltransferase Ste14